MNFERGWRVLVVDDADSSRLIWRVLLQSLSVGSVLEAENGADAVKIFKAETPDLTLLDVRMPTMDGPEALERMLRHDPDACVVMLTAAAQSDIIDDCLRAGAKDFLRKDLPPDQLRAAFKSLLTNLNQLS